MDSDLMEYYVNLKTGEIQVIFGFQKSSECSEWMEIKNNRDNWKRLTRQEFNFLVLVGQAYMQEQENLNQKDE